MRLNRTAAAAAATFIMITTGSALGQNVPTPTKPQDSAPAAQAEKHDAGNTIKGRVRRLTKLVDCNVKNTKGEKIGEVEALVIDKDAGYVAYAILSFGGFFGVGEKLFAIPFSKVVRTDDETCVVADLTKAQLERAPTFANDAWPTFDRTYDTALHDYYKTTSYWVDATRIDKDALDKDRLHARGMCRASKAIGSDVEDGSGKNLGNIDDIVIDDGTGRIVYAVLSFGGFLGMGDKLFALPWQSLKRSSKDDDKMVLEIPKDRLQSAPGFDKKNWPDMADHRWGIDIHKYYGQEPYWTPTKDQHDAGSGPR